MFKKIKGTSRSRVYGMLIFGLLAAAVIITVLSVFILKDRRNEGEAPPVSKSAQFVEGTAQICNYNRNANDTKQAHSKKECTVRIALLYGGRLPLEMLEKNMLPQIRRYMSENPSHCIDIHLATNTLHAERVFPHLKAVLGNALATLSSSELSDELDENEILTLQNDISRGSKYIPNVLRLLHYNARAWKQFSQHVRNFSLKYDLWIKFRPDIVQACLPKIPVELLKAPVENSLFMPKVERFGAINDQVAISNSMAVGDSYFNIFPRILNSLKKNEAGMQIFPAEDVFGKHLKDFGILIKDLDYEYKLHPDRHLYN